MNVMPARFAHHNYTVTLTPLEAIALINTGVVIATDHVLELDSGATLEHLKDSHHILRYTLRIAGGQKVNVRFIKVLGV